MTPRVTEPAATPSARSQARARPPGEERGRVASVRDHRGHHLDRTRGSRPVAGAELGHEQVRAALGQPQRPDAEERVVLGRHRQIGDRLVAADVEEADRDRRSTEGLDRGPIRTGLLVLGRRCRPLEEQELGPEQPDAAGTEGDGRGRLVRAAYVG